MTEIKALRTAYGEALIELGKKDERIVVLDADLAHATQTCMFAETYKDRFFNIGIAEQNMMGIASGLACSGLVPFVSTFALFGAGRAYEVIRNSISYPNLNVKIAVTHSGVTVGEDGGSHQSFEDIALMRVIPNMTVIVPADANETKKAVLAAAEYEGPVYLRIARPPWPVLTDENAEFQIGKANVLKDGKDITIFATGLMVKEALDAAALLSEEGIDAAVINIHTIKPLDEDTVKEHSKKTKRVITVEEHSVIGGLGSAIGDTIIGTDLIKFTKLGIQDRFGQSGTPEQLLDEYGLTSKTIVESAMRMMEE